MTIGQINLANTFGEWVNATSQLIRFANVFIDGPQTTSNGTLILAGPGVGLNVANDIVVYGNSFFYGSLTLGNTQLTSANILTNIVVGGNAAIQSNVIITGSATIGNDLSVTGDTQLNGSANIAGPTDINSTLDVQGAATFENTLTVNDEVNIDDNLNVQGNLYVLGTTSLNDDVSINSADLSVSGNVTLTKNLTVGENALVSNDLTVSNDATVQRNLNVSDSAFISQELQTGSLSVTSDAAVGSNLTVSGRANLIGNLTVTGTSTLNGNTRINNNVLVTGNATVQGLTTLTKQSYMEAMNTANVLYVSKDGNDANDGKSLATAKATIKAAVAVVQNVNTVIYVKSGIYYEDNPVSLPVRTAIVGDDLRTVSVYPLNPGHDLFWVRNACYLIGMTFRGNENGDAAVAFPPYLPGHPLSAGEIITSPYVQNCSCITGSGTGMRIDGRYVSGLRSMVLDAYTQYNAGGIGIHILNQGYAQLVSIFTICSYIGILCETGGFCSVTNSNSSFGDFGLVSKDVIRLTSRANPNSAFVPFSAKVYGAGQFGFNVRVQMNKDANAIQYLPKPKVGDIFLQNTITDVVTTSGGIIDGSSQPTGYNLNIRMNNVNDVPERGQYFIVNANSAAKFVILSATANTALPGTGRYTLKLGDKVNSAYANGAVLQFYQPASDYYTIFEALDVDTSNGVYDLVLLNRKIESWTDGETLDLYQRSLISTSSHTFEFIGTGIDIATATPERGGVPIQANEVLEVTGGKCNFTSTDQWGDFRIGPELQINNYEGTISGRTFEKSLFAIMTPYILSIEG